MIDLCPTKVAIWHFRTPNKPNLVFLKRHLAVKILVLTVGHFGIVSHIWH